MAIKIKNTSDIDLDSVKCVVYGCAGSGKTRLCATAPSPIIISAEEGLLSLADVSCDYMEVNNLKDFNEAFNFVKKSDNWATVCLDSLSEICESLLEEIKPDYKDPRQAYAALADSILPMLRKFRNLKRINTVFTAKMIPIYDEDTGKRTEEIMLPGRVLPSQIPYMVDELFKLNVDRKGVTSIQTRPDRMSYAKDRSGALKPIETDLNMTSIFDKIIAKNRETLKRK